MKFAKFLSPCFENKYLIIFYFIFNEYTFISFSFYIFTIHFLNTQDILSQMS